MNIIELARQSGGKVWPYAKSVDFSYDELERFAALIREECAKRIEQCDCPECSDCAAAIRGVKDE